VYVLNVVDGSFPSEFATAKAELIEEERRLLYVAMTRARDDLLLCVPLKFHVTSQPKSSGAHVYGGRSRFMSDKVMKCLEAVTFQGSSHGSDNLAQGDGETASLDVGTRLKEMW
jgi:DNA helicase-2/ATP-dependent DNA helicase PcrA